LADRARLGAPSLGAFVSSPLSLSLSLFLIAAIVASSLLRDPRIRDARANWRPVVGFADISSASRLPAPFAFFPLDPPTRVCHGGAIVIRLSAESLLPVGVLIGAYSS